MGSTGPTSRKPRRRHSSDSATMLWREVAVMRQMPEYPRVCWQRQIQPAHSVPRQSCDRGATFVCIRSFGPAQPVRGQRAGSITVRATIQGTVQGNRRTWSDLPPYAASTLLQIRPIRPLGTRAWEKTLWAASASGRLGAAKPGAEQCTSDRWSRMRKGVHTKCYALARRAGCEAWFVLLDLLV
jgi:hypothetical protein